MRVEDLDYELPVELIAREPREIRGQKRNESNLLIMNKNTNEICIKKFDDIIEYFCTGDILVLNNSKTFNAFLTGRYAGNKRISIQLCGRNKENQWQCYIPLDNFLCEGESISFEDKLTGKLVKRCTERLWLAEFDQQNVIDISNQIGRPVNSHYMSKQWGLEYYQNVFGTVSGSSELPAAGRHFSKEILEKLKRKGVTIEYITLHTGLSSIIIQEEEFEQHVMHNEEIEISQDTADIINLKRRAGGRLFGVGTTVVRTLESVADEMGQLKAFSGFTDLYIYEGYKFRIVDAFITNFHGPRSTRIALAAAFTGRDLLKSGYRAAIENKFKFFEFGDATLTI